jgi:hypothetical protein
VCSGVTAAMGKPVNIPDRAAYNTKISVYGYRF